MAAISLHAMLTHPSWADVQNLTQLTTDPSLANCEIIRDVRATIAPTHDALLVVLYSSDRHDWHLDALLSRSVQQGIRAVLLEGPQPLLSSTMALARRLNMPVLAAPDPLAAQQAYLRLTSESDQERADMTLLAVRRAARATGGVEDLLRQLRAAFGREIGLLDSHGSHIAGDPISQDVPAGRLPSHPPAAAASLRVDLPEGSLLLAHPLRPPGAHLWMAVRLPAVVAAELDALESAMLAVAPAVEQRLLLARMGLEQDARQRASVLGEVLQRPANPATRRRALELGWELDGWHTGVRVGAVDGIELTAHRGEVLAAFTDEGMHPTVVEHADGWVMWITTDHEPTAHEVQAMAAAIRRAHRRLQTTLDVHLGVGRPHPGPEGIARTLGEAGDAARLAKGRPESGHFLHVDRLGLAQLLLAWTRTDTFQPAARSLLQPLSEGTGELLTTLSTYLDAESSITEAAAVLGVHRNTVSARIARIQSLLGVDLSVPEERLALHLACRTALSQK